MTTTIAAAGGAADRRTPWSHGAAAVSIALAALQVRLLVDGSPAQAYLSVLLLAGAVTTGGAGLGMAVRNCVVARTTAVTVAVVTAAATLLAVTLGLPGGTPEPFGPASGLALLAGALLPLLVILDARRRGDARRMGSGVAGALPLLSDDADPGAARRGRPGHRSYARPGAGA